MKAKNDWVRTTWQSLPRFFSLVRRLRPTTHLRDIRGIDAGFLSEKQVEGIIWDVDGTLMAHHEMEVAGPLRESFEKLTSRDGIGHVILSNCGEERLAELGRIFPEIPVLKAYQGPTGPVLRRLYRGEESWRGAFTDQRESLDGLTPIKKPSDVPITLALAEMGLPYPGRVYMVGDQYFTDIAGANLGGISSVRVNTWQPGSFPLVIRSFQLFEAILYRILYGPVRA